MNLIGSSTVQFIWIYEPLHVLICKVCQHGIKPGSIEAHFRKVHRLKGRELQEVLIHCRQLNLSDPAKVDLPRDGSRQIRHLLVYNGYQCSTCGFKTRNQKVISTHSNSSAVCQQGQPRWRQAKLQSFSARKQDIQYWTVSSGGVSDGIAGALLSQDEEYEALIRCGREIETKEKEEAIRVATELSGINTDNRWVRAVGWANHLGGRDMRMISEAAALAMPEAQILRLWDKEAKRVQLRLRQVRLSFGRVIDSCVGRFDHVPVKVLEWLESFDPTRAATRPFGLKEVGSTHERYVGEFSRFMCYSVRVYELGREGALDQHGMTFTDRQWASLGDVCRTLDEVCRAMQAQKGEGEDEALEALDRSVFAYAVTALKQKAGFQIYTNPFLHFTAVIGWDRARGAWTQVSSFTGRLAGLVWCGRAIMLEHLLEGQSQEPDAFDADDVEAVVAQLKVWVMSDSNTPFSALARWLALGKGWRKHEGGLPRVYWEDEGRTLVYMGDRVRVADFQRAARAARDEVITLLSALLFDRLEESLALLDLRRIRDSMVFEGATKSFASNRDNRFLQPGFEYLARLGEAHLWRAGRGGGWRAGRVRSYLATLTAFRRALLAATHVWGGQPGRAPELITLRHRDTQQLARSVFVTDGQVMLLSDRDKGKAIRGYGRKVARFLPERLGQAMVAYVAWVVPFEAWLGTVAGAGAAERRGVDEHLWSDGRTAGGAWDVDRLKVELRRVFGEHTGVELGVSGYRHVAIEIGRQVKGLVVRQMEAAMGSGSEGEEDEVTGERLAGQGRAESMWDLSATHSQRMAAQHYAVNIRFPAHLTPQMMASFREVSRLWQRFLESEGPHQGVGLRMGAPPSRAQGVPVTEGELLVGLQRLLGPKAQWRTEGQRAAAVRIFGLGPAETGLIVVLPTGAGKSVFFMMGETVDAEGTTVVVVPYTALLKDLAGRARVARLDFLEWRAEFGHDREGIKQRDARLVLVSADVVMTGAFLGYAGSLQARGMLQRVFVDECHTVLTEGGFRERLGSLRGLYRFGAPVILLTATLPVSMERQFREVTGAGRAEIVRERVDKTNIRYRVVRAGAGRGGVEGEVGRQVLRATGRFGPGQKGVVYCRSRAKAEAAAERMGCGHYHGGLEAREREAAVSAWAAGEGTPWIAATTGLGTGVDIAGIVAVVHAEAAYGAVDFLQQTGRAGREEGEVAESVTVVGPGGTGLRERRGAADVEVEDRAAMREFIETKGCRRVALGVFFDGDGRSCSELAAERCDNCERDLEAVAGRPGRTTQQQAVLEGRARRFLQEAEGKCAACYVRWNYHGMAGRTPAKGEACKLEHNRKSCPTMDWGAYMGWRKGLRFPEGSCCWRCGLEEDWCEKEGGAGECLYLDRVLVLVYLSWVRGTLRGELQDAFGKSFKDEAEYGRWAEGLWVGRGVRSSNAGAVWWWFLERFGQGLMTSIAR